jgi:hypothetical protein
MKGERKEEKITNERENNSSVFPEVCYDGEAEH